ncbi:type II toxin-antitoxin system VapC family toxin [Candidatus Viridilinea mediisalina]|uniref:Ribonuclease VapC n=1 Tax=Candidatus Viridilinea mediisalina TaxID=2024553 RepID=A0A2A6RF76_9CHLR|nr:type II toxin-antitoxin system VapC family toxin [Candidatus Viridilinea mediisalina]PDW01672.1 VapC toxin family PIN domain ribonuclease [Candidatus Viridilinea mediisalina]
MSGRFLLDTNIIIALWANDAAVIRQLAAMNEVFLPVIVVGELYYGAQKSAWSARNIARIDEFVAKSRILPCDLVTAQQYGAIKNRLRTKGKPIPENNLWIAALSMQYHLVLVSRDDHFNHIDGLTIIQW